MSHKDQDAEGYGRNVGEDDNEPGPDSATRLPRDEADTEGHKHWASFPSGPIRLGDVHPRAAAWTSTRPMTKPQRIPRASRGGSPARIIAPPRHRTGSSRSPNGRDPPTIVHSRSTVGPATPPPSLRGPPPRRGAARPGGRTCLHGDSAAVGRGIGDPHRRAHSAAMAVPPGRTKPQGGRP